MRRHGRPASGSPDSDRLPCPVEAGLPLSFSGPSSSAFCAIGSSASAVRLHGLKTSFDGTGATAGTFEDLGSLAIHQSTGTVYATDRTQGVIDKFDASGASQNFSALGSSSLDVEAACPAFAFPDGIYHGRDDIAVDNSGGSNDGNIYVATDSVSPEAPPGTAPGICAFDSDGGFLWKDSAIGADGLYVDPSGHLCAWRVRPNDRARKHRQPARSSQRLPVSR